ncbi:flavodoxin [Paenibacillus cymbidii]|uniref:flavodoxin n=1 Tax=Paenibacillus cymbidii TaxID=1639034 RepID=UPI001080DF58|nr:flavodoxin [Paenibacillus cymbidii]
MTSILLVYASMTGNTEDMAQAIAEGVRLAGAEVVVKDVLDANKHELANHDGILLGAYTWGDGDLPDEFLDFYEEMDDLDLTGKKAAAFGSCDSSYAEYGAAVDTLIAKLRELGAEVELDGLKVELSPDAGDKETCRRFGQQFAGLLQP